MSEIYQFQKEYFNNFSMVGQVLDSYNQVYTQLMDIVQKFQLQYFYQTNSDEEITIGLQLSNPKIIKPGQLDDLPKTSIQAIAQKKDFMCQYNFDVTYTIRLTNSQQRLNKLNDLIKKFMLHDKITDFKFGTMLDRYPEFEKLASQYDEIKIPAGTLEFRLPVLTQSILDPSKYMTKRERYDAGLDMVESGGNIILNGVPWIVQNTLSYPYNQPIVAASTITNQLIRADYLYQQDPVFGNFYQSIFLLFQEKTVNKIKNLNYPYTSDMVLNFKQIHDINFKNQNNYIPVSLLFKAYGCLTDEKMITYCNPENLLKKTLFFIEICQNGTVHRNVMKNKRNYSQLEALLLIGQIITKRVPQNNYENMFDMISVAIYGLNKYIYPLKLGEESPYCQTLGEICGGMYNGLTDKLKLTDRDAIYNKRAVTIGQQIIAELRGKMTDSFKTSMSMIRNVIKQYTFKQLKDQPQTISEQLENAVKQFSININRSIKKSFTNSEKSKILKNQEEQKSALLSLMQKREMVIKASSSGAKVSFQQRKVHPSFYGFVCPLSTPENGENLGRYLSPTIYSYITIPQNTDKILSYLQKHQLFLKSVEDKCMAVKVNYLTQGFVKYGKAFKTLYNDLIKWRKDNAFFNKNDNVQEDADQVFISIYYNIERSEINIMTDGGRIMIPIFKPGIKTGNIKTLIKEGQMMYVCPTMIQNFVVDEYTEQDTSKAKWFFGPSGCLGPIPACNALQNHNKAVRSTYLVSQMKSPQQQMVSNYNNYYLGSLLTINQNQQDTISTPLQKLVTETTPNGQLVYMATMPYTDNQEDAMIVCEDFLQRFGFATTQFKTYESQAQHQSEMFGKPDIQKPDYNFSKIDDSQFQITKMGIKIKFNDVLISKLKIINNEKVDQSVTYNLTQEGEYVFVSNINTYTANTANNLKVVRLAFGRMPSVGDKITSKNCQKSTIGQILPGYKMPITEEGLVVNLIQDTDPVLRRETYGQLLEGYVNRYMLSKKILRKEISQDQPIDFIPQLQEVPLDRLYRPDNNEFFQNSEVLVSPTTYTVQKHIVDEKIRCRDDEGKVDMISKQPPAGKKQNGGLRIGDMERNALTASGSSNIVKNFYGRLSSNFQYYICKQCGLTDVIYNLQRRQYECKICGVVQESDIQHVDHGYNPKLLSHIFFASGVQQKFVK